jgi:hypothetical protein
MFPADDLIEKLVTESLKEVTNRNHSVESNKKPSSSTGTTKGKRKQGASSTVPMEDSQNRKKIKCRYGSQKRNRLQK